MAFTRHTSLLSITLIAFWGRKLSWMASWAALVISIRHRRTFSGLVSCFHELLMQILLLMEGILVLIHSLISLISLIILQLCKFILVKWESWIIAYSSKFVTLILRQICMLHFAIEICPKCIFIVRDLGVDILSRSAYVWAPGLSTLTMMHHELLQVSDAPHYLLVGEFVSLLSIFWCHVLRNLLWIL